MAAWKRPVLLVLVLLAAGGRRGDAQPLPGRFDCYDADDGLPHPTVTALLQDRQGFLWIGSEQGLARFDGRTFRRYTPPDQSTGEVSALLEATDGTLWVGTNQRGLFRLDRRTDRLRRASPPLSGVVQRMEEGPGGRLLLRFSPAPHRPDHWYYLDGHARRQPFRPHPERRTDDVMRDPEGRLWVLLEGGAVYRLDASATTWLPVPYSGAPGPVRTDSTAFVAWGRRAALRQHDGRIWQPDRAANRLLPAGASMPFVDGYATPRRSGAAIALGGVWWYASADPLRAWHPTRRVHLYGPDPHNPQALPDGRVHTVAADRSGLLWVGTSSRGLCRLDPAQASLHVTPAHRLDPTADRFTTAYTSAQGEVLLGVKGFLLRHPGGPFHPIQPALPDSLRRFLVKAAYRDRGGTLWVAFWGGGLWRLDEGRRRWHAYILGNGRGLEAVAARVVHEDRRGRLWVGSESGLRRYYPDRDAFAPPPADRAPTLASAPVWSLHEAADGTLWVGTYQHGLCRYAPDTARERCFPVGGEMRSGGSVSAVLPGPEGALWVGTYGDGLCRFETQRGSQHCLTEADGLLHGVIYAVLPDRRGRLWMSTQGGLSSFDPASGTFQNFRLDVLAPGLVLSNGVGTRLPSGHLAFGGVGGLLRLHPDSLGAWNYRPPVRLTGVRFFDRDVPLDTPERTAGEVRVPPSERYVAFEFAALDLLAPARLRYRYRLSGFDPGWSDATTQPTATYTNLPAGDYTFEVRATNAAGLWNAVPLRVAVVVVPPFWARTWVRLLGGLVLALGFGAAVRAVSTRRLRTRLRTLESERRVQAERLRISRDLHDHVGAQMATVLSAAELVRLSARAGDGEGAQRYADVVAGDARAAMQQLRQAVASLRAEALTPRALAERIEADTRARLHLPGAPALSVAVAGDEALAEVPLAPAQAHQLFRIAQEAVTNALRHADASRLDLHLHVTPDRLRLVVRDDGTGFNAAPRPDDGTGGGNGLRHMHARAREVGGCLSVQAASGTGTVVEASVPLG
jgi:signal transduction histidine kinase/ligand-binding sensor domain-containing protein